MTLILESAFVVIVPFPSSPFPLYTYVIISSLSFFLVVHGTVGEYAGEEDDYSGVEGEYAGNGVRAQVMTTLVPIHLTMTNFQITKRRTEQQGLGPDLVPVLDLHEPS